MKKYSFLALDIGASSGRGLIGTLADARLRLEEAIRFPNAMLSRQGRLFWDTALIFENIKQGIAKSQAGVERLSAIGLDTWGVDFGLVDKKGELVSLPFAYRDERNASAMTDCFSLIGREKIYRLTGIQFLRFNSLFQLYALKINNPDILEKAVSLLFMPDIFNFWMTGKKSTEFTFATTSQLFNPISKTWEVELFKALGITVDIMNPVSYAGEMLGELKSSFVKELGISSSIPVVQTAAHDTASAVAAVPAQGEDWAFISSGTWSIMGVTRKKPIITSVSLEKNFTNEGGWDGSFRLCKNISGLWPMQECQRIWSQRDDRSYSYNDLILSAESSPVFRSLIDPDADVFLMPEDMPMAIQSFCRSTNQPVPEKRGEFIRCIMESLALKYRYVLEELSLVCGDSIRHLHIIGGGVKNRLLCRFAADATGLTVYAGPVEATAIGNLMIQALAAGAVQSREEMSNVISSSFNPQIYRPENTGIWEKAFEKFLCLVARSDKKESHERK
jgi:rhamnulokinase